MLTKTILASIRMLLILTVLTGAIYPLFVTGMAHLFFPRQADGSLVRRNEVVIGSALIGQDLNSDPHYFWSRPSAIHYNPLPSGGSNLGPTSAALRQAVTQRAEDFRAANELARDAAIPVEMLFASGSGLDPHISPQAARLQIGRVAAARGLDREQVTRLVEQFIEPPQWGLLGQPRVNVLLLNLALDELQS